MQLSEFDYQLPEHLVAQKPLANRSDSRMLVLDRKSGSIEHRMFRELPLILKNGDGLVFNQSKVFKSRLIGKRPTGGKVEIFVLRNVEANKFECLAKSSASKLNLEFTIAEKISGKIVDRMDQANGTFLVELHSIENKDLNEVIEEVGRIPLPPYIDRDADADDLDRYQTVYAKNIGSVAAPTAGLHFTNEINADLDRVGVRRNYLSLHVGLGTFQPIKVEDIDEHKMHAEFIQISQQTADDCNQIRANKGRLIAVGTTSARSLESSANRVGSGEQIFSYKDWTDIYIKPGYKFRAIDGMLTNFHQPKSSLLVMLSAFVGRELLFEAYNSAIEKEYRFFSYGDCMLVL